MGANLYGLAAKSGPEYERWKRGIAQGIVRLIRDT
jgi:hypothetical protein